MIYKIFNLKKLLFILTILIPVIYILFNDYEDYTIFNDYEDDEDFGNFYKINLIVLYLINLLPFFYIYLNKEEKDIVPIFQLILIYFFICYSSFFIFDIWGWYYGDLSGAVSRVMDPKISDIKKTFYYFMIGLTFLNIGYFFSKIFIKQNKIGLKFLQFNNENEFLFITLFTNLIILFLYYLFQIQIYFPQLFQLKYALIYLSIGLNLYSLLKIKKNNYILKIIYLTYLISIFYLEVIGGAYAFPFMIIIFSITLFYFIKKKLPIFIILITSFLFLFLHSFKHEYRAALWNISNKSDQNSIIKFDTAKSNLLIKSSIEFYQKFFANNLNENKNNFTNRNILRIFHSTESLIVVTNLTPDKIPYWNGHSYKILSSKIIPRLFWRDKPSDILGNEFGRRYGVLGPNDFSTSWNMPALNESYVNFGIYGLSLGMFFFGVLIRCLVSLLTTTNINNYQFIAGFSALFPIFFLESHLSLTLGAVLQSFIFSIIYFFGLKKLFKVFSKNYL